MRGGDTRSLCGRVCKEGNSQRHVTGCVGFVRPAVGESRGGAGGRRGGGVELGRTVYHVSRLRHLGLNHPGGRGKGWGMWSVS